MPRNRIQEVIIDTSNQLMFVFLLDGKVMVSDTDASGLPTGGWSVATTVPLHNFND